MAVSDTLSRDLNRLVTPTPDVTPLQRVRTADAIAAAQGRGKPSSNASNSVVIPNVRREVLTVFSSLLITEDGAFEKPPNWPTSGSYPGSAFVLDTSKQYYEQRRVHYILFESLKSDEDSEGVITYSDSSLIEEQMYVPLAQPFEGNYYQGATGYTDFYPTLSMVVSPVTNNGDVDRVQNAFVNQGVTLL